MKKKQCKHKWTILKQKMSKHIGWGFEGTYEATVAICEKCLEKRFV